MARYIWISNSPRKCTGGVCLPLTVEAVTAINNVCVSVLQLKDDLYSFVGCMDGLSVSGESAIKSVGNGWVLDYSHAHNCTYTYV